MRRLLFLGLVIPVVLFGQKRDDIISLQRDVASLQDQMKALQKSQDDRLAAIQNLLQQAIEASTRSASGMTSLQHDVDTKLTEQQTKLVAPVATLGSKVDQMADEFRAVSTTVTELSRKLNAQDAKLADISSAIRTLAASQPAQPPPSDTAKVPANPCAGVSADGLWQSARSDKSGGNPELAMREYNDYVKCFADTANAPVAQYEIGMMYFNASQYDDAVKAFDVVIERFPENPSTQEALYFKAVALFKSDRKTEAVKVFKEYLAHYPQGKHKDAANANLKTLGFGRTPASAHRR